MMMAGGELIKYCRKFRGLTQKELSAKTGVSTHLICKYERGIYEPKYQYVLWCLEACGFKLELSEL